MWTIVGSLKRFQPHDHLLHFRQTQNVPNHNGKSTGLARNESLDALEHEFGWIEVARSDRTEQLKELLLLEKLPLQRGNRLDVELVLHFCQQKPEMVEDLYVLGNYLLFEVGQLQSPVARQYLFLEGDQREHVLIVVLLVRGVLVDNVDVFIVIGQYSYYKALIELSQYFQLPKQVLVKALQLMQVYLIEVIHILFFESLGSFMLFFKLAQGLSVMNWGDDFLPLVLGEIFRDF